MPSSSVRKIISAALQQGTDRLQNRIQSKGENDRPAPFVRHGADAFSARTEKGGNQKKNTRTIIDREAGFLIKYTLIIRREDARDAAG